MEDKLIPDHSRTRTASKIPTKSKGELREKGLDGKGRSKDQKLPVHAPAKGSKLSSTVGAKELKENRPPSKSSDKLAVSGPVPLTRKTSTKSMGYLEMKRVNQQLVSEVATLHEESEEREYRHLEAIRQLAEEITEHKKLNVQFKSEIEHYQRCLAAKNKELDILQHNLKEIKFENERLAAILEGAKLDAATGLKIDEGADFTSHRHKMEMDIEEKNQELDNFITGLESTISLLQEQESNFEVSLITR